MLSITDHLRLLQFGDSLLPVGSFSFSNGLESAIQEGVVSDLETLRQYVLTAVHQAAGSDAIALLEAHRAACAGSLEHILRADQAVFLRKLNEEMRTMTTRMGLKLAEVADHMLHEPLLLDWVRRIKQHETPGTFPVSLALVFALLRLKEDQAFATHQYGIASMMLSAALRLMRVDYRDGQAILFEVNSTAEGQYAEVSGSALQDMSVFAPSADIVAAIHVRSHVRMFMN
jgi:urease accessory protein